ncbi:MAG: hypothetical protein ACI3XR_07070 [Eubacteriales bacterium]
MNSFRVTVSTPDGSVFDGQAEGLMLRGALGDLAVLAGHIPMITTVRPGKCRILLEEDRELTAHTEGGLLTVTKEGAILLCSTFVKEDED